MKRLFNEFKAFAIKGNVIDLAVGVIIGGAFGKIVSSVVNDLIMPLIAFMMGGTNFTNMGIVLRAATMEGETDLVFAYGNFLQAAVDFLIIAFSIFIIIRLINNLKKKKVEVETTPAAPVEDTLSVLKEIRELLKAK